MLVVVVAGCCLGPVAGADTSTRWFAPILLKTLPSADGAGNSYGNIEVVLQVSPASKPGPFEYIYWVTNYTTAEMSDFYFTCVGIDDLSTFLPDGYEVLDGTRQGSGTSITFDRGDNITGWGNMRTGDESAPYVRLASYYLPGTDTLVSSAKMRWSVLDNGVGLAPGESIGFSFTSTYPPATVAKELASGLATRMFNGEVYAYGPEPEPQIPEWSSVLLGLSGVGVLGATKRRFGK